MPRFARICAGVLLAATAGAVRAGTAADCGLMPCSAGLKATLSFKVTGGMATVVATGTTIPLPATVPDLSVGGRTKALTAQSAYVLFSGPGGAAIYNLGRRRESAVIRVSRRTYGYFAANHLEECWPRIPHAQSVIYISNDDAAQIVYFDKAWRLSQCGD